ncbi:hypothetical protein BCE75_103276 [Isoptericola sp. CG 20/1183]|uniref:Uncharacterized protein n=1 Tax=Isoptericola halotolerans TaxID=300560 RepID=A0ABX5EG20_9MICO|nr:MULTISPECIES: hypothetical protein [Isoptericola]MCK0116461.1 hypothetical protein [Isoptericola sp. S6320L]PRZ08347.1 hypothetical protein BCL65_103277 [Isoptericola halotolerans]PRZ09144.1 hypothetical protein BCE75_103276 [Isoptericola sp. CG 20/1183]
MTSAPSTSSPAATWRTAWRAEPGRPWWGIALGDLLRVAALVSVVLAGILFGGTATALFLFVLGGTMLPRAIGTPAALDISYCAALLAAAWCAQLEVYQRVDWLDLVVHAATTGAIAAVAHQAFARAGLIAPARRARASAALQIVGLGSVVAVVWELLEWAGYTFVDDTIFVTYPDTLGDLAAGLVGSAVAAALVARGVRGVA